MSAMLFFFKECERVWCCVAVKKDEGTTEGEVMSAGFGGTQKQAADKCCCILRSLGYYDRPGEVVWTAPN